MLKVVGASWFQTRISTYILVAVILIGIGTILLGEFARVQNDNTYAATVRWKHGSGYQVNYWGQGNDLTTIPLRVARAYYKTAIHESGWSLLEIETSPEYPDNVQAYAAGLVEGSLTWQLIYHHWFNTVRASCPPGSALCKKMRKYLHDTSHYTRELASRLSTTDPFWHMVHLYYVQLDGLVAGWRYAVQRNHHNAVIEAEDFLWLAMASDLPDLERANNGSDNIIASAGMLLLKAIQREPFEPLITLAHNTAGPYARMLRLIKRYKFAYRVLPNKNSQRVPGQSIVMTSYPGALSSQDESYYVLGEDTELVVAGTPLIIDNRKISSRLQIKDRLMSASRIMAANRLAVNGLEWSRLLERHNSGTSSRQWLNVEPRNGVVSLIEQIPGFTQHTDRTSDFQSTGFLACTGVPYSSTIRDEQNHKINEELLNRAEALAELQVNITSVDEIKNLMSGQIGEVPVPNNPEESETEQPTLSPVEEIVPNTVSDEIGQLLAYRGDLTPYPRPVGVIDSKLFVFDFDGLESFEARSGPAQRHNTPPFSWSTSFPNSSHIGQPDKFSFEPIKPNWVWI